EDLGNGQLGASFDLGVRIDEWQAQLRRQPFADRGFSGPHHANENDRAPAEGGRRPPGVDRLALTHEPPSSSQKDIFAPSRLRRPIQEAGRECEPPPRLCDGAANALRGAPVLASMSNCTARGPRRSTKGPAPGPGRGDD